MSKKEQGESKQRLEALSEFRFRLRSFLRFSEDAARDAGITVLQYQVLLHTQGFPGREWASIGEIAERLQAQPHGVVALVSRCEDAGLVRRKPSTVDRRLVEVHLLPKGRKTLAKLAQQHALELSHLAEATRLASEIDSEAGGGEA
ncbi:MarR family winged helix-turn-helix transcriptional regulator [Variovorax soli]|uniref:DNA-binding MarR family transcriptional regulator n=1 Tax=Variovorax soli TaxID=376815 RepID=A0ABU1N857_9BURK|nr:MarR family winged helix-turn-helix transcriptional regulator [Variovorax soli]MDR6534620.1 DNA-binding MarR family transcriptional regulator [Variovorax soli]